MIASSESNRASEDRVTADSIYARIEELVRARSAVAGDASGKATERRSNDAAAEAPQAATTPEGDARKPCDQDWDLVTLDECMGIGMPARSSGRKQDLPERTAGEANRDDSRFRPANDLNAPPSWTRPDNDREQAGGTPLERPERTNQEFSKTQQHGGTMTEQRHQTEDVSPSDSDALPFAMELEERIREAVRSVLKEWAQGELARIIERVLKEELTRLTSRHSQQQRPQQQQQPQQPKSIMRSRRMRMNYPS